MKKHLMLYATCLCLASNLHAQDQKQVQKETRSETDSIYIHEVEEKPGRPKVLHAEPLYIDLIRDLGARKGEREWNFGFGLTDRLRYDRYSALVEYEFAPVNRLGIEVEVPVTFYIPLRKADRDSAPSARIESIKTAIQWTFFVSEKAKTSVAVGYINEFLIADIRSFDIRHPIMGNVFNPFLVAAKRWGNNFHTLLYTGPHILLPFNGHRWHASYQINTNFHYMIRGTRNFLGVELNKELWKREFNMTIRPQLRIGIADNVLIGLVAGIPVSRENERFSFFMRLIYEPGHSIKARNKPVIKRSKMHLLPQAVAI